jgi:alpha-beta hydrolase superfamily lysophospholipase
VQLFLAGQDRIIDNDGVLELLSAGRTPEMEVLNYPDQTHSIQLDAPQRLVEDMTQWIGRRGAE